MRPLHLFQGLTFVITGFSKVKDKDKEEALEKTIVDKGGTIAGKDQKMLEGVADAGSGESRLLQTSLSDRSVVLLAEGDPIKVTMKLLFGLAFGLRPLKPAWVHDSLKKHEWLPPARQRHLASLPVSLPSSGIALCAPNWSAQPAADSDWSSRLLADTTVVVLGSKNNAATSKPLSPSVKEWSSLLRAAGAQTRTELPSQHHAQGSSGRLIVMVDSSSDPSQVNGLLERARARELPVTTQDWLKKCLLEQRWVEPREVPPPPQLLA